MIQSLQAEASTEMPQGFFINIEIFAAINRHIGFTAKLQELLLFIGRRGAEVFDVNEQILALTGILQKFIGSPSVVSGLIG